MTTPSRRKVLERQLEAVGRMIVFWRDGLECVEKEIDGSRCGGGLQYGHYIPRRQSRWLKYDLGNTFCQCRNHNNLHDKGAQTMGVWFSMTFGPSVALAMEQERAAHRDGGKRTIQELEEMLARMDELNESRFSMSGATMDEMVRAGYYGDIIRATWKSHKPKHPGR